VFHISINLLSVMYLGIAALIQIQCLDILFSASNENKHKNITKVSNGKQQKD